MLRPEASLCVKARRDTMCSLLLGHLRGSTGSFLPVARRLSRMSSRSCSCFMARRTGKRRPSGLVRNCKHARLYCTPPPAYEGHAARPVYARWRCHPAACWGACWEVKARQKVGDNVGGGDAEANSQQTLQRTAAMSSSVTLCMLCSLRAASLSRLRSIACVTSGVRVPRPRLFQSAVLVRDDGPLVDVVPSRKPPAGRATAAIVACASGCAA